jgi:hypothetical protein
MQSSTRFLRAAGVAAFLVVCQMCHSNAFAQGGSRVLGADALTLDDHSSHLYTLLPPPGMTGNYSFVFPPPPSIPGLVAAFVASASAAGQIAVWDGNEWVWGDAVTTTWMGNATSAPFAFTFNTSSGPATSGALDLGDDAHHFRTLYVDNIVGANVGVGAGLGPTLSGDVSGPQGSTSVIAIRGVQVSANNPVAGQSLVYSGAQWQPTNVVNSVAAGSGIQVSSATGNVSVSVGTVPIANGGTGAANAVAALNNLLPSQSLNATKVLTTDGSNASWTAVSSAGGIASVDVSGGSTGLTTSGGPITTSGTITLGGTLAIANGGTGATSANAALNNFLPSQTGNGGKVLQTNGSNTSWTTPTNGTVTSVGVSGGSTGLTTSGGPISSSGTITLGGTLAIANGGTGATNSNGALNNLLPTQTSNSGRVLTTDGTNTAWTLPSPAGVTSVNLSGGTTGLTTSGGPITSSGTISLGGTLAIANGGTGATTQSAAINNLLPTQGGNATKVLQTDGTNVSWQTVASGGGTGWALSGNAITASDVLGTTNAQDLVIETNGTERMRISTSGNTQLTRSGASAPLLQFQGTGTGMTTMSAGAQGSTTINYVLPTSQAAAGGALSNDGSGNLSWTNIGQTKFARKTANTDVTANALGNDPHLVISVGANETYAFEAFLSISDPNASGTSYKFSFTAPSGSTIKWGYGDAITSAGAANTIVSASGTPTRQMGLNNSSEVFVFVKGILITGANSGSLQFQTMKVGGGLPSDPVRFFANSYLQAVRVN